MDCIGAWSVCSSDCSDRTYTVSTAATEGGAECPVADGATEACLPGDGECPCPDLFPPSLSSTGASTR